MIKPAFKIIIITVWVLLCFPLVCLAALLKHPAWRDRIMQQACRVILRMVGLNLTVHGKLSDKRPLMVVSNHLSYMDILILASSSNLRYTPKSEIARWPFVGFLCKTAECVFVDRRPGKVKETSAQLRKVLERGDVVSIFPEATTGSGIHVLPFKSSFFNLAEEEYTGGKLNIQPVALTYTQVSSLPMDLRLWPQVAWVGDEELVPHLWNFLALSPIQAELHYLEPVTPESFANRKELAAHCRLMIEERIDAIRCGNYRVEQPSQPSAIFSILKGK